jgi:hypothetical protein
METNRESTTRKFTSAAKFIPCNPQAVENAETTSKN